MPEKPFALLVHIKRQGWFVSTLVITEAPTLEIAVTTTQFLERLWKSRLSEQGNLHSQEVTHEQFENGARFNVIKKG